MSVELVKELLQNLVRIHEDLLQTSEQKTEVIKEGSVEKLQAVLIKERKHIQVLDKTEEKRKQVVEQWFATKGLSNEDTTITKMLELINDEREQKEVEEVTVALTEIMLKLKQQEQLNMALIQQSMQFVQLSLDLMSPSLKNMNYGNEKEKSTVNRSMFDSKA
ncbi:flagellar protein FlgN [Ornithinibacillus sp. L9]|uniref:Flagellar protein FlgN n=1 Tax=Ornithinibacillus caprae TaxID=2678566 RepID=A0A6N8FMU1_9BACI|nr:flagellar protein FlgN [Ornithinibacillus caprae]MUK90805.1 flagellar protein FlgN [Ornithinibacillus caprae]